jgi:1-deoxy-D-xylulose-5-phosphate reductoisomerase
VDRILITASGGPFRGWSRQQLEKVTPEQALKHPNWTMGAKITIDSATLMNKGLEMIEARWLFDQPRIVPIVHPQSIVHSMVELVDGTVMAQLGVPDMRLPIEVAMLYPERGPRVTKELDLLQCGALTFEGVDEETFPSVRMAREVLQRGGLFPAVYNAANEQAVRRFLRREISFTDIFRHVEMALEKYERQADTGRDYTLDDVLAVQALAEA